MAELVSCSHCGRVNRLPDVKGGRKGFFRCGSCSTTVKRTAAPAAASSSKVLDAEFTQYELSMPLVGACWLAVIFLLLGFSSTFGTLYSYLRVVPFCAAAYATFLVYQLKRPAWIWLMGGLTFFYNPMIVSLLDRVSWVMIDVAAIPILLVAPFYCPVEDRKQANRKRMKANISEFSDSEFSQATK
jgi:Na+/alanine symporter